MKLNFREISELNFREILLIKKSKGLISKM